MAAIVAIAGPPTHWFVVPVGLIAWIAVGRSVIASRTTIFEVSDDALTIRGDWYGRRIKRASLRVEEARVADFGKEPRLRPGLRVWGSGLPGYCSGWFTLNGRRGLVYLTWQSNAIYIPTSENFDLLLSPDDPEEMLRALRATPIAQKSP